MPAARTGWSIAVDDEPPPPLQPISARLIKDTIRRVLLLRAMLADTSVLLNIGYTLFLLLLSFQLSEAGSKQLL